MNRKDSIKTLLLGTCSVPFLKKTAQPRECRDGLSKSTEAINLTRKEINSPWHLMPDMTWTGSAYWANRLQDWCIRNGKLQCLIRGKNRSVYCLTHELGTSRKKFESTLKIDIPSKVTSSDQNRVGLRLGARGRFRDYRSAAIFGKGFDLGMTTTGALFIGDKFNFEQKMSQGFLQKALVLEVSAEPQGINYTVSLKVCEASSGRTLCSFERQNIEPSVLEGSLAVFSDFQKVKQPDRDKAACRVYEWNIEGEKLEVSPGHAFGPVYFAQYTQQAGVVKLTAQLAPLSLPGEAFLEIKEAGGWKRIDCVDIERSSYIACFGIEGWKYKKDIPYRVGTRLTLDDGSVQDYFWEGTIAAEPTDREQIKTLVLSCNFDYGFPDQEVVDHASLHKPDLVMFLGDQFYEPNGGFGIQRKPEEKAFLDYLRKWYQFGWSFRELFRHRPCICLPDDHDVYHGNLWGAGGTKVPNKPGPLDRDWGGFLMSPDWVNMVYQTQTSHMPDPVDPKPMKRGINVFFTDWRYAGVSFAIVEDRQFKSGPKAILPEEAREHDGFVMNEDYDISEHVYPEAKLLGERQIDFLKQWVEDWSTQTEFKVLVSATPFHSLQTLPAGPESNGHQRRLSVPRPGEYIEGDTPVADMDSGGWPQNRRDEVLRIIRKAFAVHLVGDTHLASITQYSVDDWQDAGFQFTVPALGNSWPRRWWPPVPENHKPVPRQPNYTGNFRDGFGNKMHVTAVANPAQTGLKPAVLYNRATGYGIVTFDKKNRKIHMECWPRYVNPETSSDKQYDGWPQTINQQDNFSPPNSLRLPEIEVQGADNPLIKVFNEKNNELDHILRIRRNRYEPRVLKKGTYTVFIQDTKTGKTKKMKGLEASNLTRDTKTVIF